MKEENIGAEETLSIQVAQHHPCPQAQDSSVKSIDKTKVQGPKCGSECARYELDVVIPEHHDTD